MERKLIGFNAGEEGSPWFVKVTFNLVNDKPHTEYLYFGIRMEVESIKKKVDNFNTSLNNGVTGT